MNVPRRRVSRCIHPCQSQELMIRVSSAASTSSADATLSPLESIADTRSPSIKEGKAIHSAVSSFDDGDITFVDYDPNEIDGALADDETDFDSYFPAVTPLVRVSTDPYAADLDSSSDSSRRSSSSSYLVDSDVVEELVVKSFLLILPSKSDKMDRRSILGTTASMAKLKKRREEEEAYKGEVDAIQDETLEAIEALEKGCYLDVTLEYPGSFSDSFLSSMDFFDATPTGDIASDRGDFPDISARPTLVKVETPLPSGLQAKTSDFVASDSCDSITLPMSRTGVEQRSGDKATRLKRIPIRRKAYQSVGSLFPQRRRRTFRTPVSRSGVVHFPAGSDCGELE